MSPFYPILSTVATNDCNIPLHAFHTVEMVVDSDHHCQFLRDERCYSGGLKPQLVYLRNHHWWPKPCTTVLTVHILYTISLLEVHLSIYQSQSGKMQIHLSALSGLSCGSSPAGTSYQNIHAHMQSSKHRVCVYFHARYSAHFFYINSPTW